MTFFLAQMTDTIVLVEEDEEVLEFNTLEEAEEWARNNLAYDYFILKTVG